MRTAHPTVAQYWMTALVLAVLTAAEVSVTYIDAFDAVVIPLLLTLGTAKFAIVARWFMHLKFDKPLYSRFFLLGIMGAFVLFSVVLLTFGLLVGR